MTSLLLIGVLACAAVVAWWCVRSARQQKRALEQAEKALRAKEEELDQLRRRDVEWSRQRDDASAALQAELRLLVEERVPAAVAGRAIPPQQQAVVLGETAAGWLEKIPGIVAEAVGEREESLRRVTVAVGERVQAAAHRIQETVAPLLEDPANAEGVAQASLHIDHAATVQARLAQSLRIVCGAWPGQRWQEPLPVVEAVRSGAGRIEGYQRVQVTGNAEVGVSALLVEPLIHLLAELLANAVACSPPRFEVVASVRLVQRGVVVEIDDSGAGMEEAALEEARARASGRQVVDLATLSEVPQLGLAVVGEYARRHGFRVELGESPYGGIRAVVRVPGEQVVTVPPRPLPPSAHRAPERPAEAVDGTPAGAVTATGLPRRRSRRDTFPTSTRTDGSQPAVRQAEPTPQEAGAWMNAYLSGSGSPQTQPADAVDDDQEAE
ncbi:ATP-binding protein [Streptomyces sp. 4N509B]|uniref:ATP-binding protein n=1 Tax=Streptomyces sp. 4N509B TaxID=3457413 RepID=UPI003FD1F5DA